MKIERIILGVFLLLLGLVLLYIGYQKMQPTFVDDVSDWFGGHSWTNKTEGIIFVVAGLLSVISGFAFVYKARE